ncbi:hypothetical protein ACFV08_23670 [Streptomyces fradiae]|uniref:hypothetical protein n=1 Tax=Streptomyces fradiae TaxID=1906 RepID=UPI003686E404
MTTSTTTLPVSGPPGAAVRVLRAAAILACLPYLGLKSAWLAGSRVGIPDGSVLLEQPRLMAVANAVTLLMDLFVIVLALLLTQRWGLRVRAWLLALPLWVATGLLVPVMLGFPVGAVAGLLGDDGHTTAAGSVPFLEPWVFTLVYGGFIVQGLCLGALFVRYATGRWGRLWRGTVGDLPAGGSGPGVRAVAVAAALALLPAAAPHLGWALGMAEWLSPSRPGAPAVAFRAQEALRVLYAAAAVTGVGLLVFRRGRALPVRVPLALAWTGSGAVGCWGGWQFLTALAPAADPSMEPTGLLTPAYAGEMLTGMALAGCLAVFLRGRAG